LEDELGRAAEARAFAEAALRIAYTAGDPDGILIGHYNLANYIMKSRGLLDELLAHRLAAAILSLLMRAGEAASALANLAGILRATGPSGSSALPVDFATLCAAVEQVEGVRFRELVERLAEGQVAGDDLLEHVLSIVTQAAQSGSTEEPDPAG